MALAKYSCDCVLVARAKIRFEASLSTAKIKIDRAPPNQRQFDNLIETCKTPRARNALNL
jgi:hypothetical protein